MQIRLWTNFSKRKNSTKWPDATTAVVKNVVFKENTSLEEPSFIISEPMANYTYVQAFCTSTNTGHFYFVTDVINLNSGQCEIRCTQDILATYKLAINASSQFVDRSSNVYDVMIPDPNVIMYNAENITTLTGDFGFVANGCFIITVLNKVGSASNFPCTYIVDGNNLRALSAYCNANLASIGSFTDLVEYLQAIILKTSDAIVQCKWIPFSYQAIKTSFLPVPAYGLYEELLTLGADTLSGITGIRVNGNFIINFTSILDVSGVVYSDFRKASPFTRFILFIPFYGSIDLNPLDYPSKVEINLCLDFITGDVTVFITPGDTTQSRVNTIRYNLSTSIATGKIASNPVGAFSSALGAVAGFVTAGASSGASAVASTIGASAAAVNSIASAISVSPSAHGSTEGRSMIELGLKPKLMIIKRQTSDPANLTSIIGRPLMQYRALNGLTGYIKCSDASIAINGRDTDRDELNSFLNSGFYYE